MTFETCLHSLKNIFFFFKENESENIEIYIAVDSMAYSFHWTPVHHISDHI